MRGGIRPSRGKACLSRHGAVFQDTEPAQLGTFLGFYLQGVIKSTVILKNLQVRVYNYC